MNWDFIQLPNASHGPPHIGHLWLGAIVRANYLRALIQVKKGSMPFITPRWGLVFDQSSTPEYESAFLRFYKWLNWPPDFIWYLKDFLKVGKNFWQNLIPIDLSNSESPPNSVPISLLRLLALRDAPRHWQGYEMRHTREINFEYKALFNMHVPLFHYGTMLYAEEEPGIPLASHPINTSHGRMVQESGLSYPYYITDEIMSLSPEKVIQWLIEIINPTLFPPTGLKEWEGIARLPYKEKVFGPLIKQHIGYGFIPIGDIGPEHVVIPHDWAKGLLNG